MGHASASHLILQNADTKTSSRTASACVFADFFAGKGIVPRHVVLPTPDSRGGRGQEGAARGDGVI